MIMIHKLHQQFAHLSAKNLKVIVKNADALYEEYKKQPYLMAYKAHFFLLKISLKISLPYAGLKFIIVS